MKKSLFAPALAAGLLLATGCSEEEAAATPEPTPAPAPAPEEPKKVEIPAYEPTGDHADVKKSAAADITADNAAEKAKALEAQLDAAIQAAEGKAVATND